MHDAPETGSTDRAGAPAFRRLVALLVDGSAAQRGALKLLLDRWKIEVIEAADGATALELCRHREIDFIISAWTMPGMTGPQLCRAVRRLPPARPLHFILLAPSGQSGIVPAGLEAGADDFLAMPVNAEQLHARLNLGQRSLSMQDDLAEKERRLTETLDRLSMLGGGEGDLRATARMQRSMIPPRQSRCGRVSVGALWRPAAALGRELIGFFPASDSRIAAYAIDVPGEGMSSALLTIWLANLIATGYPDRSPAMRRLPTGAHVPRDPAELAADLNRHLQEEGATEHPVSVLFADIDVSTGLVRFCQAGHPGPAILRADGAVEFPGHFGAAIGPLPDLVWETETVQLQPGERIAILSDGLTNCENPAGASFGTERMAEALVLNRSMPESDLLDRVVEAVATFAGTEEFDGDVSGLVLTVP